MINFYAPINNLGMGIHARNTMRALETLGYKIALFPPFGEVRLRDEQVARWLVNQAKYKRSDPSVMIFDIQFMTQFSGNPRIGFPVFETSGLTELQVAMLRSCDYLLTPSRWGQEILAQHNLKATIVHEGIDPEVFCPSETERRDGHFTFLHVGKFEERKGTLQLLRCFFLALEKKDAILKMHITNPFLNNYNSIFSELTRLGFIPTDENRIWRLGGLVVEFFWIFSSVEGMAAFYRSANCAVFPTKGEAWGLPILEAIACGLPTIVGNWTGQSEYLTEIGYPERYLIHNPKLEKANDGIWYHGDRGEWFVPQDDELIQLIRSAFENAKNLCDTEEWKIVCAHAREFSWKAAASQMDKALCEMIGV